MFDTGLVKIAKLALVSEDGQTPVETLRVQTTCYFGDRNVSYNRLYAARGANSQADRLIRVPFNIAVSPDDYAIIGNDQFRVDVVTDVIVKSSTRAKELTLVKLEENYNVSVAV